MHYFMRRVPDPLPSNWPRTMAEARGRSTYTYFKENDLQTLREDLEDGQQYIEELWGHYGQSLEGDALREEMRELVRLIRQRIRHLEAGGDDEDADDYYGRGL